MDMEEADFKERKLTKIGTFERNFTLKQIICQISFKSAEARE